MQEEKKSNLRFWSIIGLLILIILILLFFTRYWKIYNPLVPTGNVDVFDIDINCECDDETGTKTCTTTDEEGRPILVPTYSETEDKDVLGKVFVDDKDGNYLYHQKLNIFTNAAFEYTSKIAPGVSNTYHFVVHNSTNSTLKYYLQMDEQAEYKINLKYRLKRNNIYVIGDTNTWVSANELKTEFSNINAYSSDSYALEWQWMYDDGKDKQDTLVGSNMDSNYQLNTRFYFESIE